MKKNTLSVFSVVAIIGVFPSIVKADCLENYRLTIGQLSEVSKSDNYTAQAEGSQAVIKGREAKAVAAVAGTLGAGVGCLAGAIGGIAGCVLMGGTASFAAGGLMYEDGPFSSQANDLRNERKNYEDAAASNRAEAEDISNAYDLIQEAVVNNSPSDSIKRLDIDLFHGTDQDKNLVPIMNIIRDGYRQGAFCNANNTYVASYDDIKQLIHNISVRSGHGYSDFDPAISASLTKKLTKVAGMDCYTDHTVGCGDVSEAAVGQLNIEKCRKFQSDNNGDPSVCNFPGGAHLFDAAPYLWE